MGSFGPLGIGLNLAGPKPEKITVDYLIRTPKVEKLSLQPRSYRDYRVYRV